MLPTGRHQVGISSGGHSWAEGDRRVELQIVASRSVPNIGSDHPGIVFASPAFADSEQEAEKALALLGTCPAIDRAIVKIPYAPVDLPT